ncbi:MAG TPA: class III poly(R)-hydroxyalkanoic acid synthase subunit PhaE [Nitrospiraceae bacterium]|jgi:class III poly(R)-hydroxyalkanoic acid synthase PhaE subunit|nr:class III poly(R)-hydroxyalkanoic acid synthase subunit PhaE [Nitrospiraceae bacterium]
MSWTEQADTLVKAFTEAQTKMWESWCDLIRTAPVPTMPVCSGVVDQWREIASQGLKAWTGEAEQVVKDVAKQLLSAQDVGMRFFELSLSTWKAMAPKIESGQDWQTVLDSYSAQFRQQFLQAPDGVTRAAEDTADLWRLYLEQWQKLGQPWVESLRRTPRHFGQAAMGDGSAPIELMNLYWDTYERTFGRLLESPSLGYSRELNERLLKGFDAWLGFRRVSYEYQVLLAESWAKAFERLSQKLISVAQAGEKVESLRQLLFLWIDVIEEAFLGVFRTEEYIQMQGRLVDTAMAYRIQEREIVEGFLKVSHVPSRSELDEAYRRIYELGKEVKQLKKALQEVKGGRSAHRKVQS